MAIRTFNSVGGFSVGEGFNIKMVVSLELMLISHSTLQLVY